MAQHAFVLGEDEEEEVKTLPCIHVPGRVSRDHLLVVALDAESLAIGGREQLHGALLERQFLAPDAQFAQQAHALDLLQGKHEATLRAGAFLGLEDRDEGGSGPFESVIHRGRPVVRGCLIRTHVARRRDLCSQ